MVESISKIQQLLAESKFVEAQKESEVQLSLCKDSEKSELLPYYFQALLAQNRPLPQFLLLDFIASLLPHSPTEAEEWFDHVNRAIKENKQRILLLEIQLSELKGRTEKLFNLIIELNIYLFEMRRPHLPDYVLKIAQTYFTTNFQMRLQILALDLMRLDLVKAEIGIKELILSCFERSSPRGTKEKLNSLLTVLSSADSISHLELYKSMCHFFAHGCQEKKQIKKLIELVIYFDDFRIQALLLDFMWQEKMIDVAQDFAVVVRSNPDYDYVYFDKFLPHLKPFFFQKAPAEDDAAAEPKIDLEVKEKAPKISPISQELMTEFSDEEFLLGHSLKHQDFSSQELQDLAVSFLQSDLPRAALNASAKALASTEVRELKLKAYYLQVTCFLKLGDYRAAIDTSLLALALAETQNDVLSFLYAQAEAHLRLKEKKQASVILKRILSMDSEYRLARERLERINEV